MDASFLKASHQCGSESMNTTRRDVSVLEDDVDGINVDKAQRGQHYFGHKKTMPAHVYYTLILLPIILFIVCTILSALLIMDHRKREADEEIIVPLNMTCFSTGMGRNSLVASMDKTQA